MGGVPGHANLRIGCAGWTIPRAVAPMFSGEGAHLQRYARVLTGVEINTSFYRPHRPGTYAKWAAARLRRHLRDRQAVWCIFDNTAEGAATADALGLLTRLGGAR